ncbi:MAG: SCO family protein [Planctomycetota bacterium]
MQKFLTQLSVRLSLVLAACLLPADAARSQLLSKEPPEEIRGLEISDKLGEQVPLDIELFDATGRTLEIGEYFTDQRPVVLLLVYYDCPMLCGLMLNKMNEVINGTEPTVGEDYKIVVVSFDHTNTTEMARQMQERYHLGYDRGFGEEGEGAESYVFHTATAGEARRLSNAVGFDYRFIPSSGEFSHGSVMYVLTPDGRVSSYLSGLDYEPRQLRLALLDARDSKISKSIADFFLHMCFSFDPTAGQYTMEAFRVMQVAGVLSIVGVGGLIGGLRVIEIVRRRSDRRGAAGAAHVETGLQTEMSKSDTNSIRGAAAGAMHS